MINFDDKVKQTQVFFEIKNGFKRSAVKPIEENVQVVEDIDYPCVITLDQSTKSGYSVWDNKKQLILSGTVTKLNTCSLYDFKMTFKEILMDLITTYKVNLIIHEEVYHGANKETTETLLEIKTIIKDLKSQIEGLEVLGVNNKRWKSYLGKQDKFVFGDTEQDKKEVSRLVSVYYPLIFVESAYFEITEDMCDSIGIGIGMILNAELKAGGVYNYAKFNKKLPIHQIIVKKEEEDNWDDVVAKLKKPFRDAYAVDGLMELELNRRKGTDELFRKVLSHRDCMACIKIDKDYKDWGLILLDNNIKPSTLNGDKSFWYISVRKKRL